MHFSTLFRTHRIASYNCWAFSEPHFSTVYGIKKTLHLTYPYEKAILKERAMEPREDKELVKVAAEKLGARVEEGGNRHLRPYLLQVHLIILRAAHNHGT